MASSTTTRGGWGGVAVAGGDCARVRAPLCERHRRDRGLRQRTGIDAETGAPELAVWQEEQTPGFCTPLHLRDCEEIITVLDGEIETTIDVDTFRATGVRGVRHARPRRVFSRARMLPGP